MTVTSRVGLRVVAAPASVSLKKQLEIFKCSHGWLACGRTAFCQGSSSIH